MVVFTATITVSVHRILMFGQIFNTMKNNIKNLGKLLDKKSQQSINGGASCPTYPASRCRMCGGAPLSNGCCLGTYETHVCLGGIINPW
ncbi:conserved hypothetical protein [Tenacibaculum litopenaei]